MFEKRLRGQSGGEIFIESAEGKDKHVVQRKEAINGESIQLTIDRTLQEAAFNKFNQEGDSGVGVAVHPVTGEVLTLVSSPAYDPNEFILVMSPTEYSQLEMTRKDHLRIVLRKHSSQGQRLNPLRRRSP
ncbi:hypothetical protein [Halalkalibacter alkalisediminis]|uniref:Uncharacterized protein n=1 Tax=Halalkalibacter alkalisediminis TaxID=935616 RepID=A0ABV6NI85_9BACI|nr:hypothetical protein [Halalkalibacter alkalisediminis]